MGYWEVVSEFRWSHNQRVEILYWILVHFEYKEQESIITYHVSRKIWYSDSVLYRLEKIFVIDHEQLQFDKNTDWKLIGNPEEPDGSFLDYEHFCIHDDLFDIIWSTRQEKNVMWKFMSNKPNKN